MFHVFFTVTSTMDSLNQTHTKSTSQTSPVLEILLEVKVPKTGVLQQTFLFPGLPGSLLCHMINIQPLNVQMTTLLLSSPEWPIHVTITLLIMEFGLKCSSTKNAEPPPASTGRWCCGWWWMIYY